MTYAVYRQMRAEFTGPHLISWVSRECPSFRGDFFALGPKPPKHRGAGILQHFQLICDPLNLYLPWQQGRALEVPLDID